MSSIFGFLFLLLRFGMYISLSDYGLITLIVTRLRNQSSVEVMVLTKRLVRVKGL